MTPRNAAIAIVALIVLGAGALYLTKDAAAPGGSVSNEREMGMRAVVTEFGQRMKNVSLLAPDVSAQIAAQYAGLVAPELLAVWQADSSKAPGRYSSSPWPDRIEIVSIEQIGEGLLYRVEGNVIEVTSTEMAEDQKEVAAVQPISFMVEGRDGEWLIVEAERGSYSQLPQRQTVVGYWECLPKKGPGPHTMECAFGIALDQSDGHMAVNTMLMSTYPVDYAVGTKVRIEGVVVPANQLSAAQWQSYDIDGIINATTITKL